MVVAGAESGSCDEIIKQRVRENLKYLEELGISRDFLEFAKREYKLRVDGNDTKRRSYHKSSTNQSASRDYTGRIVHNKKRAAAVKRAEKLQRDLKYPNRSFVKPMVRSHVSGCFWLGLPRKFCDVFLPPGELRMILEDEKGKKHDVLYLGRKNGLTGGWRGFAIDHKLEDGDALIFELIQPTRFKVHIIKAIEEKSRGGCAKAKKSKPKKEGNDTKRRFYHKSYTTQSATRDYTGRIVPDKKRAAAVERAKKLQRDLKNYNRSFVKPMLRSHVSGGFWLGLPKKFCDGFLPPGELRMILEDEKGKEHDVLYLGRKNGLSGGWRGFAIDHKLEDGDALIFELIQPARFKVHIIKAMEGKSRGGCAKAKKSKPKKEGNDTKCRFYHKSYTTHSATRDYTGRIVPNNKRAAAVERAEKLQRGLKNHNRSFVKPMVRSHVSSCFWLSLPRKFCNGFLPHGELRMILEDEKGKEHDVLYLGRKTALSGGWMRFAKNHMLEDGDALIFELIQPARFKVHIIKAIEEKSRGGGAKAKKSKLKKVGRPAKCARTK